MFYVIHFHSEMCHNGITGLNVYIYICNAFYATYMCILYHVIMRTCTRAPYLWADFLPIVHLTFMGMA